MRSGWEDSRETAGPVYSWSLFPPSPPPVPSLPPSPLSASRAHRCLCVSLNRLCQVSRAGRPRTFLPGPRGLFAPRTEVRSNMGFGKLGGWRLWNLEWAQRAFPRGVIKESPCFVLEPDRLGLKSCFCLCDFISTMGFKILIS